MRRLLKEFYSKFTNDLAENIASKISNSSQSDQQTLRNVLWQRALEASADFVESHVNNALVFQDAQEIRRFAIQSVNTNGVLFEFGVHKGESINFFASELKRLGDQRIIYGFDAFLGLREDWTGHHVTAGSAFNLGGQIPDVLENVKIVKGWIEDTLEDELKDFNETIAFLHIDTDTYSPALQILKNCEPFLVEGSLILFDEFFGYPNWENHEFRALQEVIPVNKYQFLAFSTHQALLKII